jgi:hypothetical protein
VVTPKSERGVFDEVAYNPLVASVFDAMGPHSLLLTVAPFPDADDAERQAQPQGEQRFGITMVRVNK